MLECKQKWPVVEMDPRKRLAAAAALAGEMPLEAPPDADQVAAQCESWGLSVQLKAHQSQGVSWLIKCFIQGINVILGDEMGLGKTLQAIALISYLKFKRRTHGPFLVLCPLSVIDGWSSEFLGHAPKLQILRYIGSREERAVLSKKICEAINSQSSTAWDDPVVPFDVFLTTYELAMVDVEFLSRFQWRYTIIDEAQRLKNSSAVLYKTLESNYMIPRRLLLTGTPIQNNLAELWALLHFCMPKIFNNLEDFLTAFPISAATHGSSTEANEELKLLRSLLNVFMLRRTKSMLVQNKTLVLPPFSEITILARPVEVQKNVYISVLKRELPKLVQKHGTVSQMSLQNIVVQLRKACSHPYLFDGVEPEPFEEGEHLIQASGKLIVLDSFLEKLYARRHRVLIYAQMTRTLDILQDYLQFRGYFYERLDGSVRAEERFAAARKFNAASNSGANTPFVFLLTTRAGGVGLNLTAADTVIFYEQDWNPQADKQAVQRAHRIGQVNPVLAINLVTEHTIDEVILSRAKKKLKLTDDIFGGPDLDADDGALEKAKPSDLQSMIIFGLDKLHSSTNESQKEGEVMPQLAQLVEDALQQRGNQDGGTWVKENRVSDEELEENLYKFDGQDFSLKKRKDMEDSTEPADQAAVLDSWVQKLGDVQNEILGASGGRKRSSDSQSTAALEEVHAAKQRKAEEKRAVKWESLGYKSLAVQDPGEEDDLARMVTDTDGTKVHFVFGDCTTPSPVSDEAAIIFSIVDDSGVWGSGGMFSALNKLSPHVQEAYEAAHTAGDLHISDLHLLPIDASEYESNQKQASQDDRGKCKYLVALGVVQSYNQRRKVPRSEISIPALEACLRKATRAAAVLPAFIHMPRISSRPGQDRNEWYAIERLLHKHARRNGVDIFVYYYKRGPDKDS